MTVKDRRMNHSIFWIKSLLLFIFFLFTLTCKTGEKMKDSGIVLPETIGLWTRPATPQIVTANNIFDYMNGAGELYVGYRFERLEVYEYKASDQKEILVELYFMSSSDDAFGLLSLDWGGESLDMGEDDVLWPRALYGEGLLRIWSDTIYARIMAYQETPESREAVLAIGRALVSGRQNPPAPSLLQKIPESLNSGWVLRKDLTSYFRSHLVLNSLYYLGQENILDLGLDVEAFTSVFESGEGEEKKRFRFFLVEYPEHEHAHRALTHFFQIYLPEYPMSEEFPSSVNQRGVYSVEDDWLGYQLRDSTLNLIFECPDEITAKTLLDQL